MSTTSAVLVQPIATIARNESTCRGAVMSILVDGTKWKILSFVELCTLLCVAQPQMHPHPREDQSGPVFVAVATILSTRNIFLAGWLWISTLTFGIVEGFGGLACEVAQKKNDGFFESCSTTTRRHTTPVHTVIIFNTQNLQRHDIELDINDTYDFVTALRYRASARNAQILDESTIGSG